MRVDHGIILCISILGMDACAHGPSHGIISVAFEFRIRRRAHFSPMSDRRAREPVPGSRLGASDATGRRLEKRPVVEGLRVVSGGLSRRSARLTRRGVRAHVRRRGKLVAGARRVWRVEASSDGVVRGGYVARGAAARRHLGFWDRGRKEDPNPTDGQGE